MDSRNTILTEDEEQIKFLQHFKRTYPKVLIYHTPNGGQRHIATAMKMKALGVVKGIPDLFIPEFKLWVEMKRVKGKLSDEQKAMNEYLESVGYKVIVAYGCDDGINKMFTYLNK